MSAQALRYMRSRTVTRQMMPEDVYVQQSTRTQDQGGGWTDQWTTIDATRGRVSHGLGRDAQVLAGQLQGMQGWTVLLPPDAQVSIHNRLAVVMNTTVTKAATAKASVASGAVDAVTVLDVGAGYLTPPIVLLSGGSGKGATGTAVLLDGMVVGVTVTSGGSGYTSAPDVVLATMTLSILQVFNHHQSWSTGLECRCAERAA